jgi:hypothetical protein
LSLKPGFAAGGKSLPESRQVLPRLIIYYEFEIQQIP